MVRRLLGVVGIVIWPLLLIVIWRAIPTAERGTTNEISLDVLFVFIYVLVTIPSRVAMMERARDPYLSGVSLAMFFVMVLGIMSNNMSSVPATDTAPLHALEVVAAVLLFAQPSIDLLDFLMLRFNRKW